MEWLKISAHTTSDGIEPLSAVLMDCGIAGVEIIDPREYAVFLEQDKKSWDYVDEVLVHLPADNAACVVFYLSADTEGEAALADIRKHLATMSHLFIEGNPPHLTTERVNDESWLYEWKKFFAPIRVGRVVIIPVWEAEPNPNPPMEGKLPAPHTPPEITFILDPGSAFGTGQHATTFLCVEALQKFLQPGHLLLDAGCGSGILAIIGLLLGAEKAVACDIDPSAISATRKNAELNAIDLNRLEILHGNLITDCHMRDTINTHEYDIIVANIVADVVIALLPMIPAMLKPGGYFIASGIIGERVEDVRAAVKKLEENNAVSETVLSDTQRDGWHCLVYRRA